MSLATIQTAVWDVLQEAAPSAADNVTLLMALNAVRVEAERSHDWTASKQVAYLRVTVTTGSLLSAATAGYTVGVGPSGSAVSVKAIRKARRYNTTDLTWVPAHVMTYDKYEQLLVRSDRQEPVDVINPQTPEWTSRTTGLFSTKALMLLDGLRAYVPDSTTQDFKLWVYAWLDAYASFAAPADFLVTYGSDYLLWGAIEYMNFKKGTFLPRKEGSITIEYVTGMKEKAWESLLKWDVFMQQTDDNYIISE